MQSDNPPWTLFDYALSTFPFPALVAEALDVAALSELSSGGPRWTRASDQSSAWHRSFYETFDTWRGLYHRFVREHVAPRFDGPVYFQAVPTLRIHQPANVAVGEFHTDAQYNHPSDELTFWLPLTPAHGTNSVWVEDDAGVFQPFDARPGQVVEFAAAVRRHGNLVNTTGRSRVSFDFRCLPVRSLPAAPALRSVNAGLRFVPGEYYHAEPLGGTP